MKNLFILGVMLVVGTLLIAGCAEPTPPATPTPTPTETPELMNIVDTAVDAGSFTTLVAAVDAAGLTDTLSGDGPFTVFAPTDDAFAALPEGTVDTLLEEPEGALKDILLFHVVSGKVMAADVVTLSEATTLQGQALQIDTTDGVKVDGANVIITDIECSNGVIHVIDAVMIPPEA
jgi:transforming growth factor-beta-induced protein